MTNSSNLRKGIILAGGSGTRLYPSTKSISKQTIPVYDKPMIYYPLSTLMLAGIREILIISSPEHIDMFKNLFGNGSGLGISITYAVQPNPEGLAQSFIIGEEFIGKSDVCLVLGDNIFYGHDLDELLEEANNSKKPTIFSYHVSNPESFGVVEFDSNNNIVSIEEKPSNPKSNYAVTGLYFYPNDVVEVAKKIKPSERGELEITDINQHYMMRGDLKVQPMSSGYTWLDTGTPESLMKASQFIFTVEERQGIKICCPEEIALNKNWVSATDLLKIFDGMSGNYAKYILKNIKLRDKDGL